MAKLPATRSEDANWLAQRESGSMVGMRALAWVALRLGRPVARLILRPVALWYVLAARTARRSSREYLGRVMGCPASWRDIYHHLLTFAEVTLDRAYFLSGRHAGFEVHRHGSAEIRELHARGQGAILVGAHFGSFEAMRTVARSHQIPVAVVVHTDNARRMKAVLDSVEDPSMRTEVVGIDPRDPGHVFQVKDLVESGRMVALLGDRVGLTERAVTVEFLGRPVRVPTGPYVLASVLRCPLAMVFGVYTRPNRYDLHLEVLADPVKLPRRAREEAMRAYAQRFMDRLTEHLRGAPLNWFNFYAYWDQ